MHYATTLPNAIPNEYNYIISYRSYCTSSHAIPYTKGFVFILIKRYVYPSQAQASLTFVTVPKDTSAFRLSFKELINCARMKEKILNSKYATYILGYFFGINSICTKKNIWFFYEDRISLKSKGHAQIQMIREWYETHSHYSIQLFYEDIFH